MTFKPKQKATMSSFWLTFSLINTQQLKFTKHLLIFFGNKLTTKKKAHDIMWSNKHLANNRLPNTPFSFD